MTKMFNNKKTLRDYFANTALSELLRESDKWLPNVTNSTAHFPTELAKCAYSIADAMMAEKRRLREKRLEKARPFSGEATLEEEKRREKHSEKIITRIMP